MTRGLRTEVIQCVGGLDVESRYINMPAGRVIGAKNYEQKQAGGYRRVPGYELVGEAAVTGSGPIVSVAQYNDVTYAWRRNVGDTAYALYKSSGGAWSAVDLGWIIRFNTGSTEPAEGTAITAGVGITANISRIVTESGSWAGSTAAGFICLRNVVGDWSSVAGATNITGGGGSPTYCKAVAGGTQVAITGRPRSVVFNNFYGAIDDGALYWCDGEDYVIELRPETDYVAVLENACDYLEAHSEHLFFGVAESGALECSVPGSPFLISGTLGSIDIATGAAMSGIKSFKGILVTSGDSQTGVLYGADSSDFVHKKLEGVGGKSGLYGGVHTEVDGHLLYLTQAGMLFDFAAVDTYGDFASASVSIQLRTPMSAKRANLTTIGRRVDKGQARVFYDDGSAYFFTFLGGQLVGALPVQYPDPVHCYFTNADSSMADEEIAVFGSDDGFVFKMDTGTKFNEADIESFLVYPYGHAGSPTVRKRWRKLFIEGSADGEGCELRVRQGYDLGQSPYGVAVDKDFVGGDGGIWGSSVWGSFTWGGGYAAEEGFELTGTSRNTSLAIYNDGSDTDGGAHEIDTLLINYTTRAAVRD